MSTPRAEAVSESFVTERNNATTQEHRPICNAATDVPASIGRYRVLRLLGEGGFGQVYLARDEQLDRAVAVKVAHARRLSACADVSMYLREARAVAALDHPHIVPVFDVGTTDRFPCFTVSKYIDGTTLAAQIWQCHYGFREAAQLVATIAEALHYAHQQGIVHRDVKPGNILIDKHGNPFIADFGLALREDEVDFAEIQVGTPTYMSPEQARGEAHRVDGRSDIFSLGVILYEMLTRRRPFRGDDKTSLFDEIITRDPKPPRQISDDIPRELERICLRALAKRAAERYTTAKDFADDLRHFLADVAPQPIGDPPVAALEQAEFPHPAAAALPGFGGLPVSHSMRIVPKGLRSFDAHDADFFLDLLPGPRDRHGFPESIRFWKMRIEDRDPENALTVGLIYGPSGCGKSSLVKAGLLPRLSDQVICAYVEATPDATEKRLLTSLRRLCPGCADNLSLKETMAALRRGQGLVGKKLLIVLDQFEQCLHAVPEESRGELISALRQCDGAHIQCLILVRDDFYVAVNRFFQQLEVPIVEGRNYALVDLFDMEHARKVLAAFGRAYGKLGPSAAAGSGEQRSFLDLAISGLAQDGKVVCVRLALFAEMMKSRIWTPATLREVGGTQGVGVTFLEETFASKSAPPSHRVHQQAARAVLKALLPADGDIKGQMEHVDRLCATSGYAGNESDFSSLLNILVDELRLVAPAEPPQPISQLGSGAKESQYYQLTHDFLVPALREWLVRKQSETRRGRAQTRLETLAGDWNARPSSRRLPTFWGWLTLRLWTCPRTWTAAERRMMHAADRRHLSFLCAAAVIAFTCAAIAEHARRQWTRNERELRIGTLLSQLLTAEIEHVPSIIKQLEAFDSNELERQIRASAASANYTDEEQFRLRLFLAQDDGDAVPGLIKRLLVASPDEHAVITERLSRQSTEVSQMLWKMLEEHAPDHELQLRAACALATWDPTNARWPAAGTRTAEALASCRSIDQLHDWIVRLTPVGDDLLPRLQERFRDPSIPTTERLAITSAVAHFLHGRISELARLTVDSDSDSFPILLAELKRNRSDAIAAVLAAIPRREQATSDERQESLARQRAMAALALFGLGHEASFWSLLDDDDDPDFRSTVIDRGAACDIDARLLLAGLRSESRADVRQTALLALGEYLTDAPAELRDAICETCLLLYESDVSAGVHSASEWLLRRMNAEDQLCQARQRLLAAALPNAEWLLTPHGSTMVVVRGPQQVLIGSPDSNVERGNSPIVVGSASASEPRHMVRIAYSFAIGATEVTLEQFQRVMPQFAYAADVTPSRDCPASKVSWYDAVKFCRLLSEAEGIDEAQMCYPPVQAIGPEMRLPTDWLVRTGYRLPTEAEWECACRAGTETPRFFGRTAKGLANYARYIANSGDQLSPVGSLRPNPWGLFDLYGNVLEWCNDSAEGDEGRRALRSASYRSLERENRSAYRYWYPPTTFLSFTGVRIARTVAE